MAEVFSELVEITNSSEGVTIALDGNAAAATIGGSSTGGVLVIQAPAGTEALRFDGTGAVLKLGSAGNAADMTMHDASDRDTFSFQAGNGVLRVGTEGNGGDIDVRDSSNREVFEVTSGSAFVRIGAAGNGGDLTIRDSNGQEVFQFTSSNAILRIGATGNEGDLIIRDSSNREVFHFDAGNAVLRVGTTGNEGDISVRDASNREVMQFDANFAVLRVGAAGNEGDIICRDDAGNESIHLNGGAGDIILRNGDLAEQFDLADGIEALPGTVMALGSDGRLAPSTMAYDRAVVGVVAGGGNYRSGIVMDHRAAGDGKRVPIAMVGKASCRVDPSYGEVKIGDLLTASPTPGCAMRADDSAKAFGAVIGKVLTPRDKETGLVDMIISLQ